MESTYDKYSTTYPTGGEWDFQFLDGESTSDGSAKAEAEDQAQAQTGLQTTLTFTSASSPSDEDNDDAAPLLMMSMPHHQSTLQSARFVKSLQLTTLVGPMVAVEGSSWTLLTPAAPSTSFRAPRSIDPARVDAIKNQLQRDLKSSTLASEPDPYGFGKGQGHTRETGTDAQATKS